MSWRVHTVLATVSWLALTPTCARYQAKPLSPARTLAAFENRSADEPGLKAFLAANGAVLGDPPRWSLRALTLLAFYFHPDLDAARAAAAVSRGRVMTAGERPNPQVQLALGVDTTTLPPWIPSVGLQLPIETAGKRGHRLAEARHALRAAQLRVIEVAWQVRVRVRRALFAFVGARRTEDILVRQSAVQDQIVELLALELDAGAISPFELTQARLAAASGKLAAEQASLQRAVSATALADALGLSPRAFSKLAPFTEGGSMEATHLPDGAVRSRAMVNRSDVLAALADYDASQAALQLEVARQYPDLQLGPGYQLDQTDHKWTLALGLTLPIFNQNQGPIAEARARREQAGARLLVVQAAALREVSDAEAALVAARHKLTTAESLLATARQAEARMRARFDLGDVSRQEVLTAQLEAVSAEVARSDAQLQADTAAGALEDAIQAPLGYERLVLENPRAGAPGETAP